ncbi:MAG: sugar phosphate isomerase/epimerase [Lentisphaeraceae bacterium]|nr:sugar phosphate isomerase/epimerase [Lentisphaeraceae bacterium]
MTTFERRTFIKALAATTAVPYLLSAKEQRYKISLAEWSLHKTLFKGELNHLDFPIVAKKNFNISAVEFVNKFFKRTDEKYLNELNKRCDDYGVKKLLIMCGKQGSIGDPNKTKRLKCIDNHKVWVDAAAHLGCHSIRINALSEGSYEEQLKLVSDGMYKLASYAKNKNINIIIENHGGLSSDADWVMKMLTQLGLENVGTLPDFGNFKQFDRYEGTRKMLPLAKGVSAKAHDFDADGFEVRTDYKKMFEIINASKFTGYIGIEYEGKKLSEIEGIKATKALLEKFT